MWLGIKLPSVAPVDEVVKVSSPFVWANWYTIILHTPVMDWSSSAAASRPSVCACKAGACSVGIRTRVWGSGPLDSSRSVSDPCGASFANLDQKMFLSKTNRGLILTGSHIDGT